MEQLVVSFAATDKGVRVCCTDANYLQDICNTLVLAGERPERLFEVVGPGARYANGVYFVDAQTNIATLRRLYRTQASKRFSGAAKNLDANEKSTPLLMNTSVVFYAWLKKPEFARADALLHFARNIDNIPDTDHRTMASVLCHGTPRVSVVDSNKTTRFRDVVQRLLYGVEVRVTGNEHTQTYWDDCEDLCVVEISSKLWLLDV